MKSIPEQICDAGRILFARRLTDMAGGNISARAGDTVYMSPRYSGSRFHWDLTPDDLVCGSWENDEIAQNPAFSREGWSHLYVYRTFPEVQAVIHAHPFHVMPFASLCIPMKPVLEGTMKFGVVELTRPAPAHSRELADNVLEALRGKEEQMRKQAAVVLIPYHGILCAGGQFSLTLDAVERVDTNASCLLAQKWLAS